MSSWTIILITLIFSAFFSGMEIAFVSSNKLHLELDKKNNRIFAWIISIFQSNSSDYISTMLLGNNITLVIYGREFADVLDPLIKKYIIEADSAVLIIETIISTLIILVTGEFLPKNFFKNNSNTMLNIFAVPVFVIYVVLYPVTKVVNFISGIFIRLFFGIKITNDTNKNMFEKDDLDNFLNETKEKEMHEKEDEHNFDIFRKALTFSDKKVRECMLPRTEIVAIDKCASLDELRQEFVDSGLSKVLVYEENVDQIIGYVHYADMFKNPQNVESLIQEIPIVPETLAANKLLSMFMNKHKNIALVVDEFGGTAGIVTIEDILEEIFGDIQDEHDSTKFEERKISEKEYVFSARLEVDYLNDKYDIGFPSSDKYETLAGMILAYNEDIPRVNEVIEFDKLKLTIMEATAKQINLIHVAIDKSE